MLGSGGAPEPGPDRLRLCLLPLDNAPSPVDQARKARRLVRRQPTQERISQLLAGVQQLLQHVQNVHSSLLCRTCPHCGSAAVTWLGLFFDTGGYGGVPQAPWLCEHLLAVASDPVELGLNLADPTTLVVDLNCAFASIEQQHDPSLRGRPLAIAAYATDAATIVSSSREARDLGIKTGMRVFEAKAIFPSILVREPDPPLYRSVSDKLIEIMQRHSPDVLRMSIDEASMNLAGRQGWKKIGPRGAARWGRGTSGARAGGC